MKDKMRIFAKSRVRSSKLPHWKRWAAYEESGLHVTAAEADAWLARLEAAKRRRCPRLTSRRTRTPFRGVVPSARPAGVPQKIELIHLLHGLADRLFGRGLDGNDKRQVVLRIRRQLQYRFQTDLLAGENARQFGNNSRPVFHAEAQIVRPVLQRYGDRLILSEALVGKRRDTFRTAACGSPAPPASDR